MKPKPTHDHYDEYLRLGKELKQTTGYSIAEKFGVHVMAVSSLARMDNNDLRLIRELLLDRKRSMVRRKELRLILK